ncbi:MAG: exonuclease domain-containing protein [Neisseria sp.]|uniref:3'-5' exonuclease n=1 Tax=Neisseria sp. TaxID=192066 RepID=UPI0026DB27CD|nr:3'-5' exonuclease [Neisseria sp.]MDO4641072.1 exonuclease domain-containing protein [Neisseria sp.]
MAEAMSWPLLASAFTRFDRPVVIVDLETTGGNLQDDRVTEVAFLCFEHGQVVRYEWLVNPEMPIPPFVQKLTGIDDDMVDSAPVFASLAQELLPLLRGALIVAHNSKFDYTFLCQEFRRAGIDFAAPALCTVQLSRRLYPQFHKHNLDSIIERCGMVVESRHRAMADVLVLADFLEMALQERGVMEFEAQCRALMNPKMLPAWLPKGLADQLYALPERHGVLVWLDRNGKALYLSDYERMFAEVALNLNAGKPIYAQAAQSIKIVPAVGSLHALWLKAQLAAEYGLPPLQEQGKAYLTVHFYPNENGTLQAKIEPLRCGLHQEKPYGLFLHKKAAKRALSLWAAEAGLCPSVLAILPPTYATDEPCPVRQVGRCEGECGTDDDQARHNERVLAAATLLPVADWGRLHEVEITEADAFNGESMTFRCASGALLLPDGSWYFDAALPALLKSKFKRGRAVFKELG